MEKKNRRTDTLAAQLAGHILSGNWPEGSKLPSDDTLCDEFGVSRTVIREAFRLLGAKGLLEARPRRGTHVAAKSQWSLFDADLLQWLDACGALERFLPDIDDIRVALEPSFAAMAAARADEPANQALQQALRDLQDAPSPVSEINFLRALFFACGNDLALASLPLVRIAIRYRSNLAPLAAYGKMTAAIAQKDPMGARQAALQALIGEA